MTAARVLLALGVVLASASAGAWVLDRGWRRGAVKAVLAGAFAGVLLAPLAVPFDRPFTRFLPTVVALIAGVKLYDLAFEAARARENRDKSINWKSPGVCGFLLSLPNIFALVRREAAGLPRPSRREDARALFWASVGTSAGLVVFVWVFWTGWAEWPFAVEHMVKVVALYLVLLPVSAAGAAAWRLLGWPGLGFMDHPFMATTPADFWRRYNRPVGQFFHEDVFKAIGGFRAPGRAMLVVFAASAAIHEYLFTVALGRVEGYQSAFFLTQGVAAALTMRLRPRGLAAAVGIAATLAFNLATSALFFASVDGMVPFYDRNRSG
jgi:hypothetical protein